MARVKFKNEWFYPVSENAFFETELEALVVQNGGLLKEGAFVLPFKATVTAPGLPPKQPDLALIDPLYRYWWVIEVELIGHSLHGHVIPQIQTFVEGVGVTTNALGATWPAAGTAVESLLAKPS
jgi:hypothetical protein